MAGLQRQLNRFQAYYNTVRPHRALARKTPTQAYAAQPKAVPAGHVIGAHHRIRTDKIDNHGSVTLRHNSRLHHIGLGAPLRGTPVQLLIDDLHIRVIARHTGELIRELTLDPTRDYPTPRPTPRPAEEDDGRTPPGISIPARPRHRSRGQG